MRTLVDVARELDVPVRKLQRLAREVPESFIPADRAMVGSRLVNLYDDVSIDCIRILLDRRAYLRYYYGQQPTVGPARIYDHEQYRRRHAERRLRRYYRQRAEAKAGTDPAEAERCRRKADQLTAALDAGRAQALRSHANAAVNESASA